VDRAGLIVVMTAAHAEELTHWFPEAAGRVRLLGSFGTRPETRDVADPIGQPTSVYRHVRDQIESALADLILFLREHKGREFSPGKEKRT
jgi:protein-tyrosine-phosphatase